MKASYKFCEECKAQTEHGPYGCTECCAHEPDPDEGYFCLQCGKDCFEDVMSSAFDRAKDLRKYGE